MPSSMKGVGRSAETMLQILGKVGRPTPPETVITMAVEQNRDMDARAAQSALRTLLNIGAVRTDENMNLVKA